MRVIGDGILYAPNAARWLLDHPLIEVRQGRATEVDGTRVRLEGGAWLSAQAVILAGGIHANELCPELPIEPKKGHLLITDRYPGRIHHTLVELGYVTSAHNASGPSTAANIQPRPTGQLFIGAEGTLGFVVEATMRLERAPKNLTAMVLGTPDFDSIMPVLHAFQNKLDLTAFEFFSDKALAKIMARGDVPPAFETDCPFYALLEFEATTEEVAEQALATFEHCVEQGWVVDGVMSQSQQQLENLWKLREYISETISHWTPYKNDISVTVGQVPAFLHDIDRIVEANYPDFEVVWFGHIGDGNLHLNILKPDNLSKDEFFAKCAVVNQWVFETVQKYNGSISAEHGVGMTKRDYLHYSRSEAEITYMKAIKAVFDPNGIMNPGKIFPV
ncbi:hypothetical protein DOQ73_23675 [Salmonella enterica subsp. enterica]|nr:hypothetical protein [Salmonella enterica subsp. enterica serovar Javiana]